MPVTQTQTGSYIHREAKREAHRSEDDDPQRVAQINEILARFRRYGRPMVHDVAALEDGRSA